MNLRLWRKGTYLDIYVVLKGMGTTDLDLQLSGPWEEETNQPHSLKEVWLALWA